MSKQTTLERLEGELTAARVDLATLTPSLQSDSTPLAELDRAVNRQAALQLHIRNLERNAAAERTRLTTEKEAANRAEVIELRRLADVKTAELEALMRKVFAVGTAGGAYEYRAMELSGKGTTVNSCNVMAAQMASSWMHERGIWNTASGPKGTHIFEVKTGERV
ncbi:MAG: hypothetical protein ACOYBO_07730 [Azonexus sp.]